MLSISYPLGFVQSTCFTYFCSTDFGKKLKPNTESIPIFKFSTLNDRAECDLVLPWGNLIFPVFRDRNFVGYHLVWRTLDTHVRQNGQARRWRTLDDYKNWTKAHLLTKCFRTLFCPVTPVIARISFSDRGSLNFHCSWTLANAKGYRRGWFFFLDLHADTGAPSTIRKVLTTADVLCWFWHFQSARFAYRRWRL